MSETRERQADLIDEVRAFSEVARQSRFCGSLTLHFGDGIASQIETREFRRIRRTDEKKHEQR